MPNCNYYKINEGVNYDYKIYLKTKLQVTKEKVRTNLQLLKNI